MIKTVSRLNIFVDETGEFGFDKGASDLYGISFVFHEQKKDINYELSILNQRLSEIGYTDMIHTSSLAMGRDEYFFFGIKKRKDIFFILYQFSRKVPAKYYSVFIDKKYTDNSSVLRNKIINEVGKMINEHKKYFQKFDKIVLYYDNGQEKLGNILDRLFSEFEGYEHRVEFDHKEKRLFQVVDMLTYIDKYNYKHKNNITLNNSENNFCSMKEMEKIAKELNKKRI